MNFFQLTDKIENELNESFEILELHYLPFAFGSGTKCYRINGRNIKIIFDGKDQLVEVHASPIHEKYPTNKWEIIFSDSIDLFNAGGIKMILEKIEK